MKKSTTTMMKAFSIISSSVISNQNLINTLLQIFIICNVIVLAKGQNNTGASPSPSPITTPTTSESPSGNKQQLKIAIPKGAFKEFVSITNDPVTGEELYGGFAVEVFKTVVHKVLGNPFVIDFIPFDISNGSRNQTYDGMLQAVNAKDFDGAVGDITIRYDRTHLVDFTLPYSNTGITMIVSTAKNNDGTNNKLTRIKLVPLIKGLLSGALAFCFISALVFWFVEFRNDKDKQSQAPLATNPPVVQQPNKDDYRHRETHRAIIHTRLVIVLCFLVLLFLSSCYAASLTSLLIKQRQKGPSITLNDIVRRKEKIGTQKGSYVPRLLVNQKGFHEDQIVSYDTVDEMVQMLDKGNAPGGVVAVIDETAHLNVFLSKNCKGYQLVPSVELDVQGSGFAFQKGSPWVLEISKGILKLMDSGELATIHDRNIGNNKHTCDDSDTVDSDRLDSDTMWIFLAGVIGVAILVIILYMVYFGTTFDSLKRRFAFPCYLLPNSRPRNQ